MTRPWCPIAAGDAGHRRSRQCLPQSATGSFYRRQPNPRLVAASHAFTDGKLDTGVADPDLAGTDSQWSLYYQSPHGTTFNPPGRW